MTQPGRGLQTQRPELAALGRVAGPEAGEAAETAAGMREVAREAAHGGAPPLLLREGDSLQDRGDHLHVRSFSSPGSAHEPQQHQHRLRGEGKREVKKSKVWTFGH